VLPEYSKKRKQKHPQPAKKASAEVDDIDSISEVSSTVRFNQSRLKIKPQYPDTGVRSFKETEARINAQLEANYQSARIPPINENLDECDDNDIDIFDEKSPAKPNIHDIEDDIMEYEDDDILDHVRFNVLTLLYSLIISCSILASLMC
jgi:hypothetical protein